METGPQSVTEHLQVRWPLRRLALLNTPARLLTPDGPDATVVTEIYDCSRAPQEERAGMDNGNIWIEGMTRTLERLDALCAHPGNQPSPS